MEDSTDVSLEGNESNSIYLNSSMSEDSSNNTFLAKCDSCDTQSEDSSHSSFLAKCVSHDTQKFTADNSNSSSSTTCYDLVDSEDNWSESTSFRVRVRCRILNLSESSNTAETEHFDDDESTKSQKTNNFNAESTASEGNSITGMVNFDIPCVESTILIDTYNAQRNKPYLVSARLESNAHGEQSGIESKIQQETKCNASIGTSKAHLHRSRFEKCVFTNPDSKNFQ